MRNRSLVIGVCWIGWMRSSVEVLDVLRSQVRLQAVAASCGHSPTQARRDLNGCCASEKCRRVKTAEYGTAPPNSVFPAFWGFELR